MVGIFRPVSFSTLGGFMRAPSFLTVLTICLYWQCMEPSQCVWSFYHREEKFWCQRWRHSLRKTYHSCQILLGDPLHIFVIPSQHEGIQWSTPSLMSPTIVAGWSNLRRFLDHDHGLFLHCHRCCFFIDDWKTPTIVRGFISSGG